MCRRNSGALRRRMVFSRTGRGCIRMDYGLMKEYGEELPDFYEENYEPVTAAWGMAARYL